MKQYSKYLFPYKWNLKEGYPSKGIDLNGCKVFGTFICGGGSSMGYKLAGFEHLGGVEIDPKIAKVYNLNHKPKHLYNEDIRLFNQRNDLPSELYNLDILDGSPPCSTFSMAGSREKAWGKEKVFREGQAKQTLDDLVFVYCDTIIKLQPKVFILENVKGIIQGNAKVYSKAIVLKMQKAGYEVQVFCLNAASMGVPQKRERVFFIGYRKELNFGKLVLSFNEKAVLFVELEDKTDVSEKDKSTKGYTLFCKTKEGDSFSVAEKNGQFFGYSKVSRIKTPNTIVSNSGTAQWHYKIFRQLNRLELQQIGTYPLDYDFQEVEPKYLIGMSVPPVMTAQIANQIYLQWLSRL